MMDWFLFGWLILVGDLVFITWITWRFGFNWRPKSKAEENCDLAANLIGMFGLVLVISFGHSYVYHHYLVMR